MTNRDQVPILGCTFSSWRSLIIHKIVETMPNTLSPTNHTRASGNSWHLLEIEYLFRGLSFLGLFIKLHTHFLLPARGIVTGNGERCFIEMELRGILVYSLDTKL